MGVVVQEEDRDGRDPLAKTDLSRDVKVTLASSNFNSRIFILIFFLKSTMNFVKVLNQN
jgi:hypothetical protein